MGFPWTGEQPLAPQETPEHWDAAPGWAGRGRGCRRVGEYGDTSASTRLGPMAVPGWGEHMPWVLVPELCPALWDHPVAGSRAPGSSPVPQGAVCAVSLHGDALCPHPLHRSQDRGGGSGGTCLTSGFGL